MSNIDIDILTGPAAPVEHCGKPMRWRGALNEWESQPGNGFTITSVTWSCECGARLTAIVKEPS